MNKQLNFYSCTLLAVFIASSCASLTGFEEGRTLGEDNFEVGVSTNYIKAPDLFDDDLGSAGEEELIGFPNIEFNYKYGLSEKFDIGGKISTNINGSTYAKYQLVGDKASTFALSTGFELGTVLGSAFSLGIPIYTSIYPTDYICININPRYMYQFVTTGTTVGAAYLGGNLGFMFGKKHKFGLDIGYYNVGIGDKNQPFLTFGFAGKFRFGDFDFE